MKYYSTNNPDISVSLKDAVTRSLAPDGGLYMPERIKKMPDSFFGDIQDMSFQEISYEAAKTFFEEDIPHDKLKQIVYDAISFDCPIVHINENIYTMELFHGPTLAFKDVGARFMARILAYLSRQEAECQKNTGDTVQVLVATSGDTGSAVANGFFNVDGIHVYVLYPKGKVSEMQEAQFTTLGHNITAIEINGNFDDCQALVKKAFSDVELNETMLLTSANSINVARFIPQTFYYFYAYAQMKKLGKSDNLVVCVPSGNFGNLTAGLFAKRMGLPIKRFIAANNANDVFLDYLLTGRFEPRPSIRTVANAMDVGNPSNFARIMSLYSNSHKDITADISGASYDDGQIISAISRCYDTSGYVLDPHGACGWLALSQNLENHETGVFLETAHPAKFKDTVANAIGRHIDIPKQLADFMDRPQKNIPCSNKYEDFKNILEKQVADQ